MKHLVSQAGLSERFTISSAATTTEELRNDIYPNAKAELKRRGIPFEKRRARQIQSDEYEKWNLIIAMDRENLADINYVGRLYCWNSESYSLRWAGRLSLDSVCD